MPNSLFTQLGIWNKAIYKIGATRLLPADIASPSTSNNPIAQYLTDIWPFEIQEIFEEHPWSFAIQTVPLIPLNPPVWLASTAYNVGSYVLNSGFIYVCNIQYTSTSSFATDLASGYWSLCYTSNVPINPPAWASGVPYVVSSVVSNGGNVYSCIVLNTSSSSFATDLAAGYWMLMNTGSIGAPAWVGSTAYTIGQYVTNSGNIYLCTVNNTSDGTFSNDLTAGYWVLQSPILPLIKPLALMNDGCNNPYAVPNDFINPYLFSAPSFYRKEFVDSPYLANPTVILMCDNSNIATMKYVSAFPNITLWSAKFCEAIAIKLAYQLCFKISEAAQYAAGLEKDYDKKLISAITEDSNTSSPDRAIANSWFLARLAGSGAAVGMGPDNNSVGWGIPGIDF